MIRTLTLLSGLSPFLLHAQIELVHDFGAHTLDPFPRELTVCGDLLYFTAYTPANGWELWASDGTPGNAYMVKDINPGAGHGTPFGNQLTAVGNTLYFVANNGVNGPELWLTNGTEAGTAMVADLMPGAQGSQPDDLIALPDRVLFTAEVDASRRLFSAQGTGVSAVTDHVLDVTNTQRNRTVIGGVAYFDAFTPITNNASLWSSNGISAELVRNIGANSGINFLTPVGSGFYFAANSPATGRELWHSNGTENGTAQVADIEPGAGGSFPVYFTVMGGDLFFVATADGLPQWYRLQGGAPVVASALSVYAVANITNFATASDRIYFFHNEPGTSGLELYSTDGLPNGTIMVRDVNAGTGSGVGDLSYPAVFDDRLFFAGNNPATGWELWTSDGTEEGTMLVQDLFNLGDARPQFFTRLGDHIYFQASGNLNGKQLYRVALDIGTQVTETSTSALRVFPNPSTDGFTIQGLKDPNTRVQLLDALGREVRIESSGTGSNVFTTAANGWHLLRVSTSEGVVTIPVVLE